MYNELVVDSSSVGISTGITYVNKENKVRKSNKNNKSEVGVLKKKNMKKNIEKRNKNEVYNREVAERSVVNKPVYFNVEERKNEPNDEEKEEKPGNEELIPRSFKVEKKNEVVIQEYPEDETKKESCINQEIDCTEFLKGDCKNFEEKNISKTKKQVRFRGELTNSHNEDNCPKLNTNEYGDVTRRALVSRSKEETKKVICTPNPNVV